MTPDPDITVAEPPGPPPAAPPGRLPPAKRRNRWLDIAFIVAAAVAVSGISFAGGRLTAPAAGFTGRGGFGGGFGAGLDGSFAPGSSPGIGFRGGAGGVRAFAGAVVEMTTDHLTIKLDSGQTLQIPVSASTAYHSQAAASAADVQTGRRVLVQLQPQTAGASGAPTGQLAPASDITLISP